MIREKILITGANGFIGRNLKEFLSRKYKVIYSPGRENLNILNKNELDYFLNNNEVTLILHCATSGKTSDITSLDFQNNLVMFENIRDCIKNTKIKLIVFGSGAEFDRRRNLDKIEEEELWKSWPIDLYGLSKNIIARRTLDELDFGYVFRLFGCFGKDENDCRFIKSSISRVKNGLPVKIKNDRYMDFFYIEDVARAVDSFIERGASETHRNINLVYKDKYKLSDIIHVLLELMKKDYILEYSKDYNFYRTNYTGNSDNINHIDFQQIGLLNGLEKMLS